jgi:hypothetical protein
MSAGDAGARPREWQGMRGKKGIRSLEDRI